MNPNSVEQQRDVSSESRTHAQNERKGEEGMEGERERGRQREQTSYWRLLNTPRSRAKRKIRQNKNRQTRETMEVIWTNTTRAGRY